MNLTDALSKVNYWGEVSHAKGVYRANYVEKLLVESRNKNISVVMGVRRSGKSTILLQTLDTLIKREGVKAKNTLFINFEDPRLSNLLNATAFIKYVEEFYAKADNRTTVYLFLDEIQNVQNWEKAVRTLIDQLKMVKIYITGSSASLLGKELGTKLSGRYLSTEVFPVSYSELVLFDNKIGLPQFLKLGGFPNVLQTESSTVRTQLLQDYFQSIILRDVSIRYGIRKDAKLRRVISFIFSNISNQASSYRLSNDIGMSADTVIQYFKYIEDAYLGFFIPKYSVSLRKQEYNPKKFYSIDTGLQQAVSFMVMDDVGKLFENLVFLELRRKYKEIYYWEEDKEVDFLIKKGERIKLLCNVSYNIENEDTRKREIESLKLAMYKLSIKKSYLVIGSGEDESVETEFGVIEVMSLRSFLASIE